MKQLRQHRIAVVLIVAIVGAIGVAIAQANNLGASSDDCSGWVFYPEPIESTRYDGYLLCPSSGELWHIEGTKKKLVQEKG